MGASTATVVSATVPSATTVDADGCDMFQPGVTDFGVVLPGTSVVTSTDCVIQFGSSNTPSRLRIRQADGAGSAMFGEPAGDQDMGFGTGGTNRDQWVAGTNADRAHVALGLPGGGYLLAGMCVEPSANPWRSCIAKYDAAGARVASFGTGGVTRQIMGAGQDTTNAFTELALDSQGRIIASGVCFEPVGGNDLCVARFLADGTIDSTFSGDGMISDDSGIGAGDWPGAVLVRSDDRVIVAGDCRTSNTPVQWDPCMVAYDVNGRLDASFGTNGWSITPNPISGVGDRTGWWRDMLELPDGRIVTAGYCSHPTNGFVFCAARYDADGMLDPTFGTAGFATVDPGTGAQDIALGIERTRGNQLVIAGVCRDMVPQNDFCAVRLDANGAQDPTFGTAGVVTIPIAPGGLSDVATDILPHPGGWTLAGMCRDAVADWNFCAATIDENGQLDTSWGSGGTLVLDVDMMSVNGNHYVGATQLADGAVLIAGNCSTTNVSEPDACAVRIEPGPTIPDYDGAGAGWGGSEHFGACLRATDASATWTTAGTCAPVDAAYWRPVTPTTDEVASIAGPGTATARMRFGLKTLANHAPGSYRAPITFEVVAP